MEKRSDLLRILGLTFGLAIVVGGMIGVGILRTPGVVAENLGSFWPIIAVWIVGGIYTLIGANSYAELGTLIPRAGGPYVFARAAYGDLGGFVIGWSDWLLNMASTAYLAFVAAEYVAALNDMLAGWEPFCAVLLLTFFTVINILGLRWGAWAQEVTSALKVIAFFVLIASAFLVGSPSDTHPSNTDTAGMTPMLSIFAVVVSLQFVIETYGGYEAAVYFSEENENAGKNIPRALFGGVIIVFLLYLLVNLALFSVLSVSEIAGSKLPAADAAAKIFGGAGKSVITLLSLLSLLGILNAITMQTPRILFSMSRDGFVTPKALVVNSKGTPVNALLVTTVISSALAITGTFESLLMLTAFMAMTRDVAVFASLFVLRHKAKDDPRPFRAIGYPFVPAVAVLVTTTLLVAYFLNDVKGSLMGIGGMLLAFPIFYYSKRKEKVIG